MIERVVLAQDLDIALCKGRVDHRLMLARLFELIEFASENQMQKAECEIAGKTLEDVAREVLVGCVVQIVAQQQGRQAHMIGIGTLRQHRLERADDIPLLALQIDRGDDEGELRVFLRFGEVSHGDQQSIVLIAGLVMQLGSLFLVFVGIRSFAVAGQAIGFAASALKPSCTRFLASSA